MGNDVRRPARKFEDVIVWQKSHQLTLAAYRATAKFSAQETYGLVSQMRRAAASLRYFFLLARDLGYLEESGERDQLAEVGRLLTACTRTLLASGS
jgi:hypothetical protein